MWVAAGYAASILARVPTSKIVSPFTAIAPSSRTRRSASMVTTVPPAITRSACSLPSCGMAETANALALATRTQKQQSCLFIAIAPSVAVERISKAGRIERLGKTIAHLQHFRFAFEVGKDYGNVAAEFPDELAASAAR